LIETCAIKKYDLYTQALPFIICLEGDTTDWARSGQKCASQLGLDWNLINTCSKAQEGVNYLVEMAVATEKLVPAHTYVPWVVVNGVHSSSY
jgi:interferon gamma-inducible protein 30